MRFDQTAVHCKPHISYARLQLQDISICPYNLNRFLFSQDTVHMRMAKAGRLFFRYIDFLVCGGLGFRGCGLKAWGLGRDCIQTVSSFRV